MSRLVTLCLLSLLLALPRAEAQRPHRAPPAKGKRHKKHRAPPAPEPDMPVRKPVEIGGFVPEEGGPGTVVEIKGDHFDDTVQVRFNGRGVRVVGRSRTEVRVRIPRRAVTDRFVVSKSGFPETTTDREFVVVLNPAILRFRPRRGGDGTEVKVFGSHFIPADRFVVGDVEVPVVRRRHNRVVIRITADVTTNRIGVKRGGSIVARSRIPFDVVAPPPVVESFSPARGDRGTVVRITGRNFEPTDFVELNRQRLPTRSRGPGHIDVVVGNHASGRFLVRGRMGRSALSAGTFVVLRPPRIAGFSPRFGPPGTRLTVEGDGFTEGDQVYVGDAMLTIRTVSERRIVAELPAGVTGGPVLVQRGGRRYSARGRFEVIHGPAITDFRPRIAPPGARVEIHGRNFLPDASVLLAGTQLRIMERKLPHTLAVMLPPTARTGRVVVVTRGGSARSAIPLRVSRHAHLASFFPLHGLPGSRVTLRGAHFHPGLRVFLGTLELPVGQIEATTVVVTIPKEARSGPITVDTYGRRVGGALRFTVDEPRPELEFTFAPTSGRRGSEVTLFLTPPRQSVMVFFDGRPLPKKTLQRGRQVVVTIPGDARSGHFELEHNGRRYRAKQIFRVR